MNKKLTRREGAVLLGMIVLLVLGSVWQKRQLQAVQLDQKQALYAERLRTAQVILENEMLAAAHLTATDARTRERARYYLGRSPW
jgi:Tfp pilus assembly protein PilW